MYFFLRNHVFVDNNFWFDILFLKVSGTVKRKGKSFNTFFALKSQISENKSMWAKINLVSKVNIIIIVVFDLFFIIPF